MAKHKSRAKRLGEAMGIVSEVKSKLEDVKSELETIIENVQDIDNADYDYRENVTDAEEQLKVWQAAVDTFEYSSIEELKDEIESWKDNMSSANMEHLPKYDEVSECYDALEELVSNCENVQTTIDGKVNDASVNAMVESLEALIEELDERINELDEVESGEGNVSFPGMF